MLVSTCFCSGIENALWNLASLTAHRRAERDRGRRHEQRERPQRTLHLARAEPRQECQHPAPSPPARRRRACERPRADRQRHDPEREDRSEPHRDAGVDGQQRQRSGPRRCAAALGVLDHAEHGADRGQREGRAPQLGLVVDDRPAREEQRHRARAEAEREQERRGSLGAGHRRSRADDLAHPPVQPRARRSAGPRIRTASRAASSVHRGRA